MQASLSLLELNRRVRDAIDTLLPMSFWVRAELSECRESRGHCYMELIQKDEGTNTPVARASAKCWRSSWMSVSRRFEHVAGQPLRAGLQVMLLVHAQFHEAYGFSWIVDDINPEFTLGDMERKRREIIAKLKAEGIFELNKELTLPLLTQRIAVISSATAAGYGDFCRQLSDNPHDLLFHAELFPAIMQGEQVEQSVIAALEAIYERVSEFDAVVIIRGGGATADMSGFDALALAENVAQFPLPIITGIGHDRDECVLDMVANTHVKTPTAAAAFLVEHQYSVLCLVEDFRERVFRHTRELMMQARESVQHIAASLPMHFSRCISRHELRLNQLMNRVTAAAAQTLHARQHDVDILAMRAQAADPQRILERGYSLTTLNGRAVRDASQLRSGMTVQTRVMKGSFAAVVKE